MRWLILLLSLLSAGCNTTSPVVSCREETSFSAAHTTQFSAWGRFDQYVIRVVLDGTDPCYSDDGGTVSINGIAIPMVNELNGPSYSQLYRLPADNPFRFDGTVETFQVSGSTGFPSMTYRIPSFQGAAQILSPTPFDTISRDSDLLIEWQASPGSSDSVVISVFHSRDIHKRKGLRYRVPDTGRHTVSAEELGGIATGELVIQTGKGRFGIDTLSDGRPLKFGLSSNFMVTTPFR